MKNELKQMFKEFVEICALLMVIFISAYTVLAKNDNRFFLFVCSIILWLLVKLQVDKDIQLDEDDIEEEDWF